MSNPKISEKYFCKLLEAEFFTFEDMLQNIAQYLGMDFIKENTTIFISTNQFVVEIDTNTKQAKIEFVNIDFNIKYAYISDYINVFVKKPDIFYKILKFLVFYLNKDNLNEHVYEQEPKEKYKSTCFCNCVLSGEYCKNVSKNCSNIFTHSFYETCTGKDNIFCINQNFEGNLHDIFEDNVITVGLSNKVNSNSHYQRDNFKIKQNTVFFNDKKNDILTFLFQKGANITQIEQFVSNNINKLH